MKNTRFLLSPLTCAFAAASLFAACSSDDGDSDSGDDGGASDGDPTSSTSGDASDGGADTDDPTGASDGGSGATDSGADTTGGDPGGTSTGGFDNVGQCAFEGEGAWADGYSGTHDLLLIADSGSGAEICRVSFELVTVGEPDMPCDFCYWSTVAEFRNPTVVTDVEGACGNSQRGLDQAAIDAMVGTQIPIGFAEEATGHGDVLVQYDPSNMQWNPLAFGTWDPDNGTLFYENVDGFCEY